VGNRWRKSHLPRNALTAALKIFQGPFIAISAVKKSDANSWEIEHQCPQCGAPVTLEETDRLFFCPYCRIRLYLASQDYFRYYLPPAHHASKDFMYVPYWRYKGTAFFCKANKVGHKLIDVSSLASPHTFFPYSLGVRPQVLKLRFISPEMEGKFFSPSVPVETLMEAVEKQLHSANSIVLTAPILFKAFIGEMASLIYFPVFVEGDLFHDGILGRPVANIPEGFVDDLLTFDQQKDWRIQFVSTLCPTCGWDLHGERDSVALFCNNCDSVWEASQTQLEKVSFGMIPDHQGSATYLPFWVMKTRIEELNIRSYGDLLRIANVRNVMGEGWEKLDSNFWAPAFKVSPGLFLRLTRRMTLSQTLQAFEPSLPKGSLYPVTLPVSKAVESIKVILANIVIDKQGIFPRLSQIDIQLDQFLLVYLPFHFCGNELIHSQTQSCIHKNFLKLGRNL
jgi:DNA-directed RNA polymerase subunit RPC12/RpoP